MRYKYLKKLKQAIKREDKLRKKYVEAKVYTGEMAKQLSTEYYAAESDRNSALDYLHAYGLSHEALSEDEDFEAESREE